MDLVTVLGLVFAFGLILAAIINGGPLISFFDVSSVLIVVLGSIAALMVAFPTDRLTGVGGVLKKCFLTQPRAEADGAVARPASSQKTAGFVRGGLRAGRGE